MDNQQPSALPPLPPLPELLAEHKNETPSAPSASQSVAESMRVLKTPPPPPPPVAVRSLQSDLQSLEASGGIAPKAAVVKLDDLELPMPAVPAPAMDASAAPTDGGGAGKMIASMLGGLVLIVGVGAAGYFWIYPALFGGETPTLAPGEIGAPTTGVGAVPAPKPVAPAPIVHRSLFAKLPTFASTVTVSNLTREGIMEALQQEASGKAPTKSMKELSFVDGSGAPLRFADVTAALLPGIDKGEVQNMTEEDFTGFLYYNEKGVWPGYVAKLKSTAVVADAQAVFAGLEGLDIAGLYLNDPGASQGFQTGPFKGSPIRYSVFAAPGASLNYGAVGDYMVIATSFEAFKASVDLLGL